MNPALLDLLVKKGILSTTEANSLRNATGSAGMEQLLLILKAKGMVNESDVAEVNSATEEENSSHMLMDSASGLPANLVTQSATQAAKPEAPKGPVVIPAAAPVRVLALDPPKKEGLVPAFKLGGGVAITPYGFIKATFAQDSTSPNGDDFPRPGFLNSDTGPNNNPNSHLKARATRFGTRIEWPDASKKLVVTGQIEADFEGNFSRADNRNVSTIRSNALQLRLAYGRIDYNFSEKTDFFFEAGQDWTIFGSSALANLFESTFFGAYWGNLYERSPQMRLGFVQKLGGSRNFKLSPEFAIMMPSEGNVPADSIACTTTDKLVTTCTLTNGLGNQLGYGERQGADYAQPTYEGRVVLQFQLDKAPAVPPAQILWSGFYSGRQATVLGSTVASLGAPYSTAFPRGVDATSNGYGNQVAISLPTRWLTFVASGYQGADLRFFFGGQTLSNYTSGIGLTNLKSALSVDGSSTVWFGTNSAGAAVVAPQRSVRSYGGFFNLGLPVSRWFNADPKGRNAGWQVWMTYGLDAANADDFEKAKISPTLNQTKLSSFAGAGPVKSNMKALTVFYKLNPWVQFGFEETKYESQALPNFSKGVCSTKIAGLPNCNYVDWRTEFGPVFTF